ncbi:MAG: hypothetical protein KDE22_18135 [Rhodobacterales bacterium]|nr:hypothetical protein [Rhodobacterales bacterium]
MADTPLHTPLDDLADAMTVASSPAVALAAMPLLAQVNLRADPADAVALAAIAGATGLDLPTTPNIRVTGDGDWSALWLGPDEWLLVGPEGAGADMANGLRTALGAHHVSVVDVSANRVGLDLTGPRAADVLAKGCALDLHPRVMGPDACVQTVVAKAPVMLHRLAEPAGFRLLVRNSFAHYLTDWLTDAMGEYGAGFGGEDAG